MTPADEDDDWPGDDEPALCDCGRPTVGEGCQQCGTPLCPMCFEVGAGFCGKHPDDDFMPEKEEDMATVELHTGRWCLMIAGLVLAVEADPNREPMLEGSTWNKHTLEQAAARINAAMMMRRRHEQV
jgi:hypothetical protein